ncbi:MAG: SRPBCC family protein [Usitatibacteraceae bacterium]
MNDYESTVDIDAPLARVWETIIDIERWPEWTTTVSDAKVRGGGKLQADSAVTVHRPKFPTAVWHVTAFEPEKFLELRTGLPGMRIVASRTLVPRGAGCTLTLTLAFKGMFAGMFKERTRERSNRYLTVVTAAIKRRCESAA